ncbi:VOC family protein [Sphingomonas crocodyli]|uniref:Glyoxalase n=1 Tax=Sphingomonas crocodyli TaxID=1979270 RepID=A0A437LVL0_9SPHN|nr:VOC family protein [Sphingomonas crocodyli]RVT89414.1 glyoxalase [Sphingomonas crocodyli]
MPVAALDHVNVRTTDIAGTLAFYRDVLGMEVVPAPGANDITRSGWVLDTAKRPIIHVGSAELNYPSDGTHPFTPANGSGAVHHVAIACTDAPDMRRRLEAAGLDVSENAIPSINMLQLFAVDPNGIMLEMNFRDL